MIEKRDVSLNTEVMEENVREILSHLGEDPTRTGLKDTPERFTKAMRELTSGYLKDPKKVVGRGIFEEEHTSEQVLVKDIEFYSLCEHHVLPFTGKVHVAYLPNKKVIGLSKIPRLVEVFARRLQVQERLTDQIAQSLMEILDAKGVAVAVEAEHFCMMMRGVNKQLSSTFTLRCLGEYNSSDRLRAEFLTLVRR